LDHLRLFDEDSAAVYLIFILVNLFWHFIDISRHEVVWNDIGKGFEPEERYFSE